MTDQEIRIAVAEIAGFTNLAWLTLCEGTGMDFVELCSGVPGKGGRAVPDYPNDANAVISLLEKYQYVDAARSMTSDWTVAVFVEHYDKRPFVGKASTFARAACIALLKSHRVYPST